MDKHNLRINIFNETLALIKQGWYIATDGTRVELPSVDKVMEAAEMYTHKICFDNSFDRSIITEIHVEDKDCVQAAQELINVGFNPAMLNLADLYIPGGIVEYGSGAQEENLCRRSNLVQSLYQFSSMRIKQYPTLNLKTHKCQYPMDELYGGVYSGIVTFFRTTEQENSALVPNPYNIPVISVAAINKPQIGRNGMIVDRDVEITLEKIRTIFRIGMIKGHDSLVLSAFGCGAFANPPKHIARLFHQVIEEEEFKNVFKLIEFAILDGYRTGLKHNPEGNLKPFLQEFGLL